MLKAIQIKEASTEAIHLLSRLISIPSISKEENKTADLLEEFLKSKGVTVKRKLNNVWAVNKHFNSALPTILLNSHHDTVKPNTAYTLDPYNPKMTGGKLFGLGSNDAGGALVSLLFTFLYFYNEAGLKYNILYAATAEEEISGNNGVELVLPEFGKIDFGIVGEPTQMQLAVAEKGLLVLDCVVHGKAGHAAREEGENAIYKALNDIEWFRMYRFPKLSEALGSMKMSVTIINAGKQHNVVPDKCEFVVDVRVTDAYTHEEVINIIRENVTCEVKPRSLRLRSSSISLNHPIVKSGISLGRKTYGSPTTSDKGLMNFPTLKMGPGDSARSHMADEFIFVNEIQEGIELYVKMLNKVLL